MFPTSLEQGCTLMATSQNPIRSLQRENKPLGWNLHFPKRELFRHISWMVWDQELDPGKCSPDPSSGKNTVWWQPLAVSYFRSVSVYLWHCGILRTVFLVSAWNDSTTVSILMASVCCWALFWTDKHLILNQGLCFFLSQECLSNISSIHASPPWPYQHSKTRRVIQDKEIRWVLMGLDH